MDPTNGFCEDDTLKQTDAFSSESFFKEPFHFFGFFVSHFRARERMEELQSLSLAETSSENFFDVFMSVVAFRAASIKKVLKVETKLS